MKIRTFEEICDFVDADERENRPSDNTCTGCGAKLKLKSKKM